MKELTIESKGMRTVTFYVLIDPITKEVRYVGKTVQSLKVRLQRHMDDGKHYVKNWIQTLRKHGVKPIIKSIGECREDEDWQTIEKILISEFRYFGYRLCNICEGGIGASGIKRSPEFIKGIVERLSIGIYSLNNSTQQILFHKSHIEAARVLGIKASSISRSLSNNSSSKGYLFSVNKTFNQSDRSKSYSKKILCTDKEGVKTIYKSSNQAGKILGLCPVFIRKVANGKYKQYKGLKFKYYGC